MARKSNKENILNCAYKLFCEKGYDNTSMRDIAEEAGVTIGAYFNHYRSKKTMLVECMKLAQQKNVTVMQKAVRKAIGKPKEEIVDICYKALKTIKKDALFVVYTLLTPHLREGIPNIDKRNIWTSEVLSPLFEDIAEDKRESLIYALFGIVMAFFYDDNFEMAKTATLDIWMGYIS